MAAIRQQKIPLSRACSGMIVSQPITHSGGGVLMGAGTELTPALIERLARLEIDAITVQGRPLDTPSDGKSLPDLLAELDQRFTAVRQQPFCQKVHRLIARELTRRHTRA